MKLAMMATVALLCLGTVAEAKTTVNVWFHAGRGGERQVLEDQIARFNIERPDVEIKAVQLPEGSYNDQISAAAMSGALPDLLDFDGPLLANYVWSGYVRPLDDLLPKDVLDDLLPSLKAQGTYPVDGKLYGIGTFDSGLALWANRPLLEKAGIRIPTLPEDVWTLAEFEDAMERLSKLDGIKWPLDAKLSYGNGEWFTYGFSPILQSFGGDLIDRKSWKAAGTLDGDASVRGLQTLQGWIRRGWVTPASAGDTSFYGDKTAAMALVGHWAYPNHDKGLGENAILIPMPKFGDRQVTGLGSWNWGISADSKHPTETAAFLAFLMRPEEVVRISNANGAVPGRKAAIPLSSLYKEGGRLNLYYRQLLTIGVSRPFHPAYPLITRAFADAVSNVASGADVKTELRKAAARIDRGIAENGGYPPFGGKK
ncbi:sugar ABC transporter substrate-binding protein (plasmid) [Azospirillum sp. A26]|uniref:ABC transporter substrate-binding protein n=1 Tax=Azospirillum sp. A26 TaxID=3160607 RepID=UPI003671B79B